MHIPLQARRFDGQSVWSRPAGDRRVRVWLRPIVLAVAGVALVAVSLAPARPVASAGNTSFAGMAGPVSATDDEASAPGRSNR